MSKRRYVYKWVSQWDGKGGISACITQGAYCLSYELNKETKSIGGTVGVVVYKTLRAARWAALEWEPPIALLRCTYKGSPKVVRDTNRLWKGFMGLCRLCRVIDLLDSDIPGMIAGADVYAVDSVTPVAVIHQQEQRTNLLRGSWS